MKFMDGVMMNKNKLKIHDGKPRVYEKEYEKDIEKLNILINKNKVTNIGILGPYSSGKSSLIETYRYRYPNKRIIKVSLGKYNVSEEKTSNEDNILSNNKKDNNYKLELSILEQLIFAKHPFKINSTKSKM